MEFEATNEPICTNEPSNFVSNARSDALRVYVYQPFVRIRHIKLNAYCSIDILNGLYSPNSIYIFNGQILDTKRSFASYNLVNGNKIVCLPSHIEKSNPQYMEKWLRLTSDKENFEKRIDLNIKQSSRKELARIKDIKFQKLELKRKRFISYLRSRTLFQANLDESFSSKDQDEDFCSLKDSKESTTLNINYESTEPSCAPLPVLWI